MAEYGSTLESLGRTIAPPLGGAWGGLLAPGAASPPVVRSVSVEQEAREDLQQQMWEQTRRELEATSTPFRTSPQRPGPGVVVGGGPVQPQREVDWRLEADIQAQQARINQAGIMPRRSDIRQQAAPVPEETYAPRRAQPPLGSLERQLLLRDLGAQFREAQTDYERARLVREMERINAVPNTPQGGLDWSGGR